MALPVEILLGIYLGVLTGVVPALVAWGLGFLFRYMTGVTIPGFGVVVLGVAIAGINGGLLGLYDQTIRSSPTLITATLVVLMMTLYAHNRGDRMGAAFPHRFSLNRLRSKRLSAEAVELIGGRGQIRVTIDGQPDDLEAYPPLSAELRADIAQWSERFPADLPLPELERRIADRLRTEFDLGEVTVELDEHGRATIAAAPPAGALSRRVPPGKRAVSVDALVPTGLARHDEVRVLTPETTVEGIVISASSDRPTTNSPAADGGTPERLPDSVPKAPTTSGGEGRVTVAVDPADAERLLAIDEGRILVCSRGSRREYELLSILRSSGVRIRKLTVRAEGALDGTTVGAANTRTNHGVAILALRQSENESDDNWQIAPSGDATLRAGDQLFVAGPVGGLTALDTSEAAS